MTDAAARARAWRELVLTGLALSEALERQTQRDAGMPHSYYVILVALAEAPGRELRLGALAERAGMSRSRLSHAVASMERSGWVERAGAAGDGRGAVARLAGAGRDALRALGERQREALRRPLLAGFDAGELDALAGLLARARAAIPADLAPQSAAISDAAAASRAPGAAAGASGFSKHSEISEST